ncbi:TonB family protein [Granulicella aggregans]|uniref:TonB family protein n=1 Tax=Granulicella aggregans TaxID=474949 RepID=A0A7W8E5T9_9BACT|nr:energy transducer TonB [Granulicella aggregans]MBB5059956.1 TonB family protein [Granulicella aggregans]
MAGGIRRWVAGAVIALLAGVGGSANSRAQEPVFFYNNGAIRYTEAAGVYHYVFPCKQRESAASDAAVKFEGICWPVVGTMILKSAGSEMPKAPVAGVLLVSAGVVHFGPIDPGNSGLIPDQHPGEVRFSYLREKSVAVMESALGTLVLKLRPVCEGCTPGAPSADPARQAQVDGEYAELKESLTDYAALAKRVKERAAFLEVAIAPKTEPGMEDVAEAMGLYAAMNERVAPMCGETARACVRQYSKYEACKKDDLHAECGVPPSCEATCALTETGFRSLNATVCRTPKDKASMLIPDWSAAGERLRAQQKAYREKMAAGTIAAPATPTIALPKVGTQRMDFMGKPIDPAAGCTVEEGYALAMMTASTQGVFGQLGTSPAGTALDVSRISGGVAASNLLSKVDPVYPAVAKAAHIAGTVALHVLITEQGEVTNLTVVSGPPLLRAAAVDAVKQWRYKPYVVDGVVRKAETVVLVNFNFGGPPGAK